MIVYFTKIEQVQSHFATRQDREMLTAPLYTLLARASANIKEHLEARPHIEGTLLLWPQSEAATLFFVGILPQSGGSVLPREFVVTMCNLHVTPEDG